MNHAFEEAARGVDGGRADTEAGVGDQHRLRRTPGDLSGTPEHGQGGRLGAEDGGGTGRAAGSGVLHEGGLVTAIDIPPGIDYVVVAMERQSAKPEGVLMFPAHPRRTLILTECAGGGWELAGIDGGVAFGICHNETLPLALHLLTLETARS